MENGIIRSWVTAPKFLKVPSFLRKLAFMLDLDIEIQIEKGWFRETTFYKVSGSGSKLKEFQLKFQESIEENHVTIIR